MREADLPGPRHGAPADDRRGRGAVVRRPERRRTRGARRPGGSVPATEWMRVTSSASSWVKRREDRRQAAPEHRLARARRPGEQEVVRTRRQRARAPVCHAPGRGRRRDRAALPTGRDRPPAARGAISSSPGGSRRPRARWRTPTASMPGERGLRRGVGRAEHAVEPCPCRSLRRRDRPGDGADAAVEAELADARMRCEPLGRDLRRCGEHA